jgi:hypothetical protein
MKQVTKKDKYDSVTLVLKAYGWTSSSNAHIFKSANDAVQYVRDLLPYTTKVTDNFNPNLYVYAATSEDEETEHASRYLEDYKYLIKRKFCVFSFGVRAAIRVRTTKYPMLDADGKYDVDGTPSNFDDSDVWEWLSPEEYKNNMELHYEALSMMPQDGELGE